MKRASLMVRVAGATMLTAILVVCITVFAAPRIGSTTAAVTALLIALPVSWWGAQRATGSWSRVVQAVRDGVSSLRDHDFSISITPVPDGELRALVTAYNSLGDLLRRERLDLYQRELLLDTVIQTTPLVMVLTNTSDRIVYSNVAARQLFHDGRKLEGLDFTALLADSPAPLREALTAAGDTLFTMEVGGEPQVYHLSQRSFRLNAQAHRLVLLKQLTRELAAQEVVVWKKVIRVIAARAQQLPRADLIASAFRPPARARDAGQPPNPAQLERVFTTIGERTAHLTSFIEGYARFAKLPRPRPAQVVWADFLAGLEGTTRSSRRPAPADPGDLRCQSARAGDDQSLKNAAESGSAPEEIAVQVASRSNQGKGRLRDPGRRSSAAASPRTCYATRYYRFIQRRRPAPDSGLTLCREIVEAHGGRLSLANRPGGGALVSVWLPSSDAASAH